LPDGSVYATGSVVLDGPDLRDIDQAGGDEVTQGIIEHAIAGDHQLIERSQGFPRRRQRIAGKRDYRRNDVSRLARHIDQHARIRIVIGD
jgi:hypothetical protein